MTNRLPINAIDVTGADAANDTPRYNPTTGRLEYAPGGATTNTVRETFTADANDAELTLGATPIGGRVYLWLDGLLLVPAIDYTVDGGDPTKYTLTNALTGGETLHISWETLDPAPTASTLLAAPASGYAAEVLADSPLAFWQTDESAAPVVDSSGNGGTLTLIGGLTVGAPGPFADTKSLSLDGSDDYAQSNVAMASRTSYAIEFFYKGTDTQGIVTSSRGSSAPGLRVGIGPDPLGGGGNGRLHFGVSANSLWVGVHTALAINDDLWHHAVCMWDGAAALVTPSQLTVVVDGNVLTGTGSTFNGTNGPLTSANFAFGFGPNEGGGGVLAGNLSCLALYSSLTVARAQAHYAAI